MVEQRESYNVPAVIRDDVLVPTWERMKEQAKILHDSGFFPKAIKKPSQALAVMLAGRELGLGPMESLRSVYIVNGQTTISSGLMGAMIWQAGHAYNIDESTAKVCQITFTRSNGQKYTHRFTHEDAVKAGLAGKDVWRKYEKAMLFNRCISGGGRAFMPDITRRMYTPEEMGAPVTVSESGDVVIDAEVIDVTETTANGDPPRPWQPDVLKKKMLIAVSKRANATGKPSQDQIGLLAGKFEEVWPGDKGAKQNRYEVLGWLTGTRSAKDLSLPWISTLLKWLLKGKDESGNYEFNEHSREEARLVYRQAMLDQGQQELDIPLDAPADANQAMKDAEAAKSPEQHREDLYGNDGREDRY